MPFCTVCKTDQLRRKDGACPNCNTEVEEHGGYWYPSGTGSPSLALLKHFERRVSRKLSAQTGENVTWKVAPKGTLYKRELVAAKHILDRCANDLQLAFETLDLLFEHPTWAWKGYNSLLNIQRDFDQAHAVLQARKAREQRERETTRNTYQHLDGKEDIFD